MVRRGSDLTYRAQLLMTTCGLVLLVGIIIFAVADRSNRITTRALVNSLFREVSGHAVTQTKDFIFRAAPVAQSLEQLAGHGLDLDNFDTLATQLLAFLKANEGMTWVLYGDESGDYAGATRLSDGRVHVERTHMAEGQTLLTEYEVHANGSWTVVHEDNDRGYDPRTRPYYILAKERGKLAWTPPFMFFTQGVPGISCVMPVYGPSGELRGVFSVEFDLNALSRFVAGLTVSEHSRVFLYTPDGTLLAHPNQRGARATGEKGRGALLTLADAGDPLVDAFRQHLGAASTATQDTAGFRFFEFRDAGVGYLASTTVFPVGDGQSWVVGAIAPESDYLAEAWRTRWLTLAAAALALCIAAIVAAALARRISRPVQSLIGFMQRVGEGDLEAKADFHGGREFRELAGALNRMIIDLRERLHLRNSLQVAMDVQRSLLPAHDPISPLLDVAGRSRYCDETGGDYYDFIEVTTLSPSSLLVAIGDVMGHGIPSALVMATARAALRTSVLTDHRLADIMTRTNRVLAADNRHNRFMTLLLLMIDAETRVARWASAGHDPVIVFDPATDSFRELEGGDVPLGISETSEYQELTSDPLPSGAVLMLGTDGVWEMFNEKKEQYGKERVREIMRKRHREPAAQIATALEAELSAFRGVASSVDDVTFVVIKLAPRPASPAGGAIPGSDTLVP